MKIPELPLKLCPYDSNVIDDVLNVLAWHVGEAYRQGVFNGHEDIDFAAMDYLFEHGMDAEQIHKAFETIFLTTYDARRTQVIYERLQSRKEKGEKIAGAGSFVKAVKDKNLTDIQTYMLQFDRLTGKFQKAMKSITVVSISDFLSLELPPRDNMLSPWLPTQGLAMVHGIRGIGKTHFVMGVAVAVSSKGRFLKWEASKPFGVLYLDGEMPAVVVQERFSNIIISSEKEPIKLNIVTPDLQESGMPDLSTLQGQASIDPYLDGISLVIVDNISTFCRGGRENEGESWLPVQEWGLRLRSKHISVLFVHHSGKGGFQRGTSRREDVLDTVISLKRPGDYMPDEGARFEVHFEKARNIHGDDVKPFEAKLYIANGIQQWAIKSLEESLTERVANLLNDGIPQNELADLLGVAKGTVSKHKRKAQIQGLLRG